MLAIVGEEYVVTLAGVISSANPAEDSGSFCGLAAHDWLQCFLFSVFAIMAHVAYNERIKELAEEEELRHIHKWCEALMCSIYEKGDAFVPEEHLGSFLSLAVYTERFRRTTDLKALALQPAPVCECRSSPVHGYGVFATVNILQGCFITWYPADGFVWIPLRAKECSKAFTDDGDSLVDATRLHIISSYTQAIYLPIHSTEYNLNIFGDPEKRDDPLFIGHMINDGGMIGRGVQEYNKTSNDAMNCVYDALEDCIVATRNIAAGEELFHHYGSAYWDSRKML